MKKLQLPVTDSDQQTGNLNAALTLVEYGDYQCPFCRHAHSLVQRLLQEHGSELRFVFRNFPLRKIHAEAAMAAYTAEAAGRQGKFWQMHDLLFANQHRFHEITLFHDLARKLELDMDQFLADVGDTEIALKVENDFRGGIYSSVDRTPTFFLNEEKVYLYDGTYSSLLTTIELFV
ncbi:MAG TPA: thioredoxin domain-containing protein [Cyclobacteriaceae bacterium]